MNKQYHYMIYVGRFQPPHKAHIATIQRALELSERVIVLIGSANEPRTIKDPFTWKERELLLRSVLTKDENKLLFCRGISNDLSDDRWAQRVQDNVHDIIKQDLLNETAVFNDPSGTVFEEFWQETKIGIIGYEKDDSSFYLKMFPQWKFESMRNIDNLHATEIRRQMFELKQVDIASTFPTIRSNLDQFMQTNTFAKLVEEYNHIQKYQQSWAAAPYPPTFVTADAIVVQSGHILLIRHRSCPGEGLWAIPGGFVNQKERVRDAAIRELREETKLKVPEPVLRGSIKNTKVYDNPNRSLRGRTITHAFLIELPPGPLPKVKGSDDAEKATWIPLADFQQMRDQMFEDHFMIIQDMIGNVQ